MWENWDGLAWGNGRAGGESPRERKVVSVERNERRRDSGQGKDERARSDGSLGCNGKGAGKSRSIRIQVKKDVARLKSSREGESFDAWFRQPLEGRGGRGFASVKFRRWPIGSESMEASDSTTRRYLCVIG